MFQSSAFEAWLAWPGIIVGLFLILGSLEFVGRFEEQGWKLAGTIVPITYVAWSLWLISTGIVLLANYTDLAAAPRSTVAKCQERDRQRVPSGHLVADATTP
jgi:hypothetical protein